MKVSIEEFSRFGLFKGVPSDKLSRVAALITIVHVDAGTTIIEDGTTGSTMYLLLSGEVEIAKNLVLKVSRSQVNQGTKMLNTFSDKDKLVFGELALLDEKSKRSATVIAKTPCTLGVIEIKPFLKLAEDDKEVGYYIFKNMATQLSVQLRRANEDALNLTTALSFALRR